MSANPPVATSVTRSRGVKLSTGSALPARNSTGAVIVVAARLPAAGSVSSQLRSKLRYQFSGPVNPVRSNSPV